MDLVVSLVITPNSVSIWTVSWRCTGFEKLAIWYIRKLVSPTNWPIPPYRSLGASFSANAKSEMALAGVV